MTCERLQTIGKPRHMGLRDDEGVWRWGTLVSTHKKINVFFLHPSLFRANM